MKKNTSAESGTFNPRIFAAFVLCSMSAWLAMFSFASTPTTGTLTDTSGPITYTAGPFNQPNRSPQSGAGQLDKGPRCGTGFPCDSYLLTVTMPTSVAAFPDSAIKVTMGWTDAGTGQSDYDLYIFKGSNPTVNGATPADYQSASSKNPEIATIFPVVADGQPHPYTIKIVPYTPSGEPLTVKIEFFQGTSTGSGGGGSVPPAAFGGPDPTVTGNPRFMNFYAPSGSAAESSTGEFNIGFNPNTNRIMVMNSGPIFRITPPELLGKPECCEGLWQDKSNTSTNTGLDPVLSTDRLTGRTFASNSTAGANGLYAVTDDDGDTYIPVSFAPPDGADHQTIEAGNYPAALAALGNAVNRGRYVLYCSQTLVGSNCQRSDNLGTVYGPAVISTGPGTQNSQGCGGLHGHVRIAPDGTAYLPDKSCGTLAGGAVSIDAGTTPWHEFQVQKTVADADGPAFTTLRQVHGADPSIGIDQANTIYYCYVNNQGDGQEGHVHCAVGKRNDPADATKINWIRDTDVGLSKGVINAAHPETIAGSAGRAAVGFLGTNVAGNYESGSFPGVWYAFVATTYDEGRTWVTINATPNDPVQSMTGIWQQGGSGDMGDRNLLDFNEITMDNSGRVLYGYSDGCTSPACVGGTSKSNLGAFMRVARQSGGRTLLASFDSNTDTTTPILPKAPCLSGTRNSTGGNLSWKVPDNGGSEITAYNIYRSTASGAEVQIGTYNVTSDSKAAFNDPTADPAVPDYFYKIQAVNALGQSVLSNEVDLKLALLPACVQPSGPFFDDLEPTPEPGWQVDTARNDAGAASKTWQVMTDPNAHSPTQSFFSDASTVQPKDDRLIAPPQNVSATTHLTFWHRFQFENGYDGGVLEVSTDFGDTWVDVVAGGGSFVSGGYNGTINPAFGSAIAGRPAWTGGSASGAMTKVDVNLGAFAGSNVKVRFRLVTDFLETPGVGWFIDDIGFDNLGSCPLVPTSVVSRKTHGSTDFDINVPLTGTRAVEPRSGGASSAYTLVFTFPANVANCGTSTSGSVSAGPAANQCSVNLSGVPNAQYTTVTLTGPADIGGKTSNVSATFGVLIGDVNASGAVDGNDVSAVQSRTRQAVGAGNFKNDVNVTGRIDGNDVSLTQSMTRTRLP